MVAVWPLVGREEELDWVSDSTTPPHLGVVLAGPAGVGKTRLVTEILALWRTRGRDCRWFGATRSAQSVPLGVFAAIAETSAIDPLRRIRDVITTLTTSTSAQPVLLAIDDAHLLDEQSALVLNQIVRHRRASVLITVRGGAPSPDAIRGLWKDQLLDRLDLQPLSTEETTDLVTRVLGGPIESSAAAALWRYTRGNVLHLRHLVDGERSAHRLALRSGVWVWRGRPQVSAPLAELVEAGIARQPAPVLEVVDMLSVADPLEVDVLTALTDTDAVESAVQAGLIGVDTASVPPVARLVHPLLGEVRRANTLPSRLQTLRGTVAGALETRCPETGLIQRVRRAVLVCESDLAPNAQLCRDAAVAALKLADPVTAERLARRAVEAGGGRGALLLHAGTLTHCIRLDEALAVNTALQRGDCSERERVFLTLNRAAIWTGKPDLPAANRELAEIETASAACGLRRPFDALKGWVASFDTPALAVDAANAALTAPGWFSEFFELFALTALVRAHMAVGRYSEMSAAADRGYAIARESVNTATFHVNIGLHHLDGYHRGGYLDAATRLTDDLHQAPGDFPIAFAFRALSVAMTALACGDLLTARTRSRETLAIALPRDSNWLPRTAHLILATATAMSGDATAASALLDDLEPRSTESAGIILTQTHALARAWTDAAAGVTSHAIAVATDAATIAQEHNRPAYEVVARQTATQFGDRSHADRLTELTALVQGPRVGAAAAHATALRDNDPDGLCEAARAYEAFGDLIAAADTAAQGADLFRRNGFRGAALTAAATARRLAARTGADTPALRADTTPSPLTRRQREVIALVAAGLTNRQIADRLVMSVRTVEGHLFRASQKTGINTREGLAAALDPSRD
ncbi:AAA family ATPase [Nocardia sp. BSTN01]|uniref:LuxR C-terminal-related transcriptional regulator n=1 Tax=Nocardia sp. BSTN01 TaxID=2783665 RepID=UPI00188F0719|nr:LuxR family transcriptional regulator [Nocardia sp. BSTN01]MBF4999606.1 AAA family ATPase [Nocardia sp. BSTN01]